jgi:F-type H+-transporting ATPase subunit c
MTGNLGPLGAGLAALGVLGPGIGIGILAGLASSAIGRNPDAAGQIRGLAIILAAFAEGLGVLAIVVGILSLVLAK